MTFPGKLGVDTSKKGKDPLFEENWCESTQNVDHIFFTCKYIPINAVFMKFNRIKHV